MKSARPVASNATDSHRQPATIRVAILIGGFATNAGALKSGVGRNALNETIARATPTTNGKHGSQINMTDMEALLRQAAAEIQGLRRTNEILLAKVEVMELFACVLHTEPARRGGGMSPDVAWQLIKEADKIAQTLVPPDIGEAK
jgi:hypothetical protein